jgi:hypothetical protein
MFWLRGNFRGRLSLGRGAALLGVAAPAMFIVKCGDSRSSQKFENSR